MTDNWPQIKARLEGVINGVPYEGTYAVTNLREDIRAALQRVEHERGIAATRAETIRDQESRIAALRQRVEEQQEQLRKSHERTLYLSQKLMESECHNVRGEDGPCECVGCQDVAALRQRVEELEQYL